MTTETDQAAARKAQDLYRFDGSDPDLILALRSAFRAGAEFATDPAPAPAPSVAPEAATADQALAALVEVAKIGLPLEERRMVDEHAAQIRAALTAPTVAPEVAVERAARAMQAENAPKPDPLNRDQREEQDDATIATYRTLARAALTAALPHLTAAPSATREDVIRVVAKADGQTLDGYTTRTAEMQYGDLATAILARFTITPKETDR